ncbi:F0F1 ATP synthase subunit epsilon [Nitrospirillum iridis]|uniref:ATP synthase epsilon chain n=1 Tax=Nitrospirillum iridis TaxID=765888 RepID=A0A7X0B1Z6_9PROT|nr:F0F1 ATP synthase subunit epsilon [Nitrospirillum iridis]MBB6254240.1 F-type H+-transporting ATPase subunit epsilon [Nitrospirillum iridis]
MNLRIVTPLSTIVEEDDVRALRAEDASGGFGILPGHADLLTRLAISIVQWRRADGGRRYCAVRGGVLTVTGGTQVTVATREAIAGGDIETLDKTVLDRFRVELDQERLERTEDTRLQLNAIRQIMRHLRPDRRPGGGGLS